MRSWTMLTVFAVALAGGITVRPASAQFADVEECRQSCQEGKQAGLEACQQFAGRARGLCKRAARVYAKCCKKKFCTGRVADLGQCVRSQF